MKVDNESRIDFEYRSSEESPVIRETIFSNVVSTIIVNDTLLVTKWVDKICASIYDILVYRIEILNITDKKVNNIIFKDEIPKGLKFINNTLVKDGETIRCKSPEEGVDVGDINVNEKVTICFKVVICNICFSNIVVNICNVTFDYIYNIEELPVKVLIDSNKVVTKVNDNLFKKFNVSSKICFNCLKNIESIAYIKVEFEIIEVKIMESVIRKKSKHIKFIGVISYEIYYMYKGDCRVHNCDRGFSTSILVPNGVVYLDKIDYRIYEEDTNYLLVNNKNIFINTEFLVKIGK